jgi:hypothetical protein
MPFTPIDPVHDARHVLADTPNARESLAFVVGIPEARAAFIAYTWVNALSEAGAALAVFGPGIGRETPVFEAVDGLEVGDLGFADWKVGPMRVRHDEPLHSAEISFAGTDASVSYTFTGMHPAYNYGAHPDGCPWYLAEDRYEQSGHVHGTLRIGERVIAFDSTGHRDHSWGTRNWGAIQHWKWIWAQTPAGAAVHLLETFGLGRRQTFGYVFKGGTMAEITDVTEASFDLTPDLMHEQYSATVRDDLERTTTITCRGHSAFVFPVSPEATMHEVAMHATIDGVAGPGHVEMGWPNDYLARAQGDEGVRRALSTLAGAVG